MQQKVIEGLLTRLGDTEVNQFSLHLQSKINAQNDKTVENFKKAHQKAKKYGEEIEQMEKEYD